MEPTNDEVQVKYAGNACPVADRRHNANLERSVTAPLVSLHVPGLRLGISTPLVSDRGARVLMECAAVYWLDH